ncbi:MAG TPA: S24/S26 family peptidase [Chloroflexota bacterium]|jgi:hypothetical protein
MDEALAALTAASDTRAAPATEPRADVAPGDLAADRLRALSTFLLDHQSLLLPLASGLRADQPTFETTIRGSSMWPTIRPRTTLRVQVHGPEACERGAVVFYQGHAGYTVHRVVYRARRGARADWLVTRGDNCLVPDPPVRSDQVVGTIVATQQKTGWQPPGPAPAGALHERAIQAATLHLLIATLWVYPPAARGLGRLLLRLQAVRLARLRRLRQRLRPTGRSADETARR